MTIKLRGHHLLCILTFVGKGYTPAFADNFEQLIKRLKQNQQIEIVDAPDDICQGWLDCPDCHCHDFDITIRDRHALHDVGLLLGQNLQKGDVILLDEATLTSLRAAFAGDKIRKACKGCQWEEFCTQIAQTDFRHTCL